ncbi:MAG: DUF3015 family protein [Cellvibrio sp.]
MKFKTTLISIVLSIALPSVAMAAEKEKSAGSGPNPFSDCGIGAAIFSDHKVLAVTSNVIWDIGTTALTSATASPETCSGKKATAAKFIIESYDSLAEETAKGQGEHLATLMNILEVDQVNQAAVIATLRAEMAKKLAKADYTSSNKQEKSIEYYDSVMVALSAA